MNRVHRAILLSLFLIVVVIARGAEAPFRRPFLSGEAMSFRTIEVSVDSGDSTLAAYQFELLATGGKVMIVGTESLHPAFTQPPVYDTRAGARGRIVLANFDTTDNLPSGSTRVARVHVAVVGDAKIEAKLMTAVSVDGTPLAAKVSLVEGEEP